MDHSGTNKWHEVKLKNNDRQTVKNYKKKIKKHHLKKKKKNKRVQANLLSLI